MTAVTEPLPRPALRPVREPGWWGMILLITTEAALFAYLIFSYFYVAAQARSAGPAGTPSLHLALPNTLVLLASSATMWWADRGIRSGDTVRLGRGLLGTLVLGALFLAVQIVEYGQLPFSPTTDAHGSLFYLITGFHSAHVAVGLLMLATVLVRTWLGHFRMGGHLAITVTAWYWHFVDIVWLAVFTTLYLSPRLG